MVKRFILLILFVSLNFSSAAHAEKSNLKEWTFLVFLNGHNNLDSFGEMNIKQMEKVGSTDDINIVVQWASMEFNSTKRLLITKSTNPSKVTSPVVDEVPLVDMGDYKSLVDFVRWAAQKYPAKHYFLDIWNHGGGWHRKRSSIVKPSDISWDDRTGNFITTKQLGTAINEISRIIGQKLDIYASDACLMAMLEVGHEMKDSASLLVGSQENEPAEGWPYDTFFQEWTKAPKISAAEVTKLLTKTYIEAYSGGQYGDRDVTFSSFDLGKLDEIAGNLKTLGEEIKKLDAGKKRQVLEVAKLTESYDSSDYKDMVDFINRLEQRRVGIQANILTNLKSSVKQSIVSNASSEAYKNSHGISLWIPSERYYYDQYASRYSELHFDRDTDWGSVLKDFF